MAMGCVALLNCVRRATLIEVNKRRGSPSRITLSNKRDGLERANSTVHTMDTNNNKDPTRRTRSTSTSIGGKLIVQNLVLPSEEYCLLILSVKSNLLISHSTQLSLSCKIGMF